VYPPAERADAFPLFHLYPYVLCGPNYVQEFVLGPVLSCHVPTKMKNQNTKHHAAEEKELCSGRKIYINKQ
jgi:hypothetical protein